MKKSEKTQSHFIKGSTKGILLLHGLTATPNDFKHFTDKFTSQKFTVSVPLLRGHGTKVEDLEKTAWYDWFEDSKNAYNKLRKKCKQIVVIGQSMGGALALHLASHYKIDGLVLLAPGLIFKNKMTFSLPLISILKKYLDKPDGPDIKNDVSRKKAKSYSQTPLKSVEETAKLFEHVKQDLPEVHVPIIIFHSVDDHVIDYKSSEYIYNKISSKNKRLFTLHNSYHVLSLDNEKNIIFKEISRFIKSVFS